MSSKEVCDTKCDHKVVNTVSSKDAFASVAVWQMLAFVLLLAFIWVNERWDFASRMFDADPSPFNFHRACLISAAVIVVAIVAVGHTYERQRAIIKRLHMTCVYCHRVMHEDGDWENVEDYFMRNYPMEMPRGACPDCEQMLKAVNTSAPGGSA